MLNLAFIGVGHAHARHRLGVRACLPHAADRFPVARVVLHFSPDEVIAGIRHRTVRFRTVGAEYRAAGYLLALHHFDHDRIPNLGIWWWVERWSIFPFGRIEYTLIDRAGGRCGDGAGVLAGWRGQREPRLSCIRVICIRICSRWWCLAL